MTANAEREFIDQGFDLAEEEVLNGNLFRWFGRENFLEGNKGQIRKAISCFVPEFKNKSIRIVTIAGTNGKGETAHGLENLLRQKGLKTALWTSPHILSLRERFLFSGKLLSYKKLGSSLAEARKVCEEEEWTFSYYEFLFFVFCRLVMESQVDVLILEVGLGGRLDAVNFLEPDLTAVISISRDHQKILGNKLSHILREKLGITRPGVPLITALELGLFRNQTTSFCEKQGTSSFDLFEKGYLRKEDSYSFRNQTMATFLCEFLLQGKKTKEKLCSKKFREVVRKQKFEALKGRFEKWVVNGRSFCFVGAHNIDGVRKLTQSLEKSSFDDVILSFSKRDKKDILNILEHLVRYPCVYKKLTLTTFDHEKAYGWDKGSTWPKEISLVDDWKNYFDRRLSGESVLITGSYYFIGEVQKYLHSRL